MEEKRKKGLEHALFALTFSALIAVGANVEIVLGSVSFILSDFFVLLAGLLLPWRWAALSLTVYLLMGLLGLPVFSEGGSGWMHLTGHTGGYLIGFLIAAMVVAKIAHSGKGHILRDMLATLSGQATFFILGVSWLKFSQNLAWADAINGGFIPFLLPASIKFLMAVGIAEFLRKFRSKY